MSIFNKIHTIAMGHVNDILDKAIDLNSPSALREYGRELEDSLNHMKDNLAQQTGMTRTLQRQVSDLTTSINSETETIKRLLARTDSPQAQELAKTKASAVVKNKTDLTTLQTQLADQQNTEAAVKRAVDQLQAKYTETVGKIRQLELMDQNSKSKEQAAKALNSAVSTMNSSVSVDNLENKMRTRQDVASAKFDQALGSLAPAGADVEHDLAVDDFLKSLQ